MFRAGFRLGTLLLVGGGMVSPPAPLAGQNAEVVDRIVAVVGTRPILQSEVDEQVFVRYPEGKGLPTDSQAVASLRRDILDEMISQELMLQKARSDTTIKVLDEDVQAAVDQQARATRARYATDAEFRRDLLAAGFQTEDEWRSWYAEEQRKRLTLEEFRAALKATKQLQTITPTEQEMREYFAHNRGDQKRPETLTLRQIVVAPQARPEAKQRAFALADSIAKALRAGGDFATAAKRFSMDPGSAEQGGSLNWFRRGVMDPAFERVAFGYKPGVISDPVETSYGYHVIQVQRVQAAEVQARHILIQPEMGTAEGDSARALAERIRDAVAAGASFDSLQVLYHDPAEQKEAKALPVDQFPAAYRQALAGVKTGELAPVIRLEAPDLTRSKYAVVQVVVRDPAGELRFEDVKERLRGDLTDLMTLQRYIQHLRDATYVEIKDPSP